jgi:ABC-type Fe3+/spermidine/putrescine transport system ATPase subunit
MAKIVIRNLNKTYSGGEVVALQDINLEVEPYESLCILGASGCGKTTLLRIVAGLEPASAGDVLLDGRAVRAPGGDRASFSTLWSVSVETAGRKHRLWS